ncbi:MAG TPA: TldD/PmbA family protein [Bryobacteraceae bacterium]|nr:TldD/PmbA family protein [Bryobacteraceae bacterium]
MRDLAQKALDAATRSDVDFADVRFEETRDRQVSTRNGKPGSIVSWESGGVGIRVFIDGCQGFAATDDLSTRGIERAAALAAEIARSGRLRRLSPIELAQEPPQVADWSSPCAIDPFSISVEENLRLLAAVEDEIRRTAGITLSEASMSFSRRHGTYVNSLGSRITQTRTTSGAGFTAYSFRDDELQKRSYPNSFGGQYQLKGYELLSELDLPAHAGRIAEEAVALHSADPCPAGDYNLILDSSQLGLQIHESIGHPIELDRVLGSEANYAGLSFLTPADVGRLRYGSGIVNVVADATIEHGPGLGTFAFDDEGVPAQCTAIIRNGEFTGFLSSRETARAIGQERSGGCMRAEGWNRLPLVRMTNISLLPGPHTLDEVFTDGIYMQTNRSWSIDDKRYNFQFGCEIAWEIRGGKRVRMLKDPTYSGISTEFWNSCDAIADERHWTLWGVPNCGKGQPEQVMGTGHGASPARFRNVRIGSASLED